MADKKGHLNIDTDFLDKKEAPKAVPKTQPAANSTASAPPPAPAVTPISTGYKYKWKNILIVGGIVLFIGWAMFSGSSDSSSSSTSGTSYTPTTQTSNYDSGGNVIVGQYSCSSYYANQADSMAPNDSTKQELDTEQSSLSARSDRLDSEKSQIDNMYVDETDQSSIDNYNYQVDSYNSQLTSYKRDASSLSDRIDAYNAQVDRYNSYLQANCTKRY